MTSQNEFEGCPLCYHYNCICPAPVTAKTRWSVVVRDPNSWSASTGVHEELANCGHSHKTQEAAERCKDKLTAWHCLCGRTTQSYAPCCRTPHNSTSAKWYQAQVEDSAGEQITVQVGPRA
jgi:hypothetical protein